MTQTPHASKIHSHATRKLIDHDKIEENQLTQSKKLIR